jgi:adenylate cyclase
MTMQAGGQYSTMATSPIEGTWSVLQRAQRTIVVVDVVESVRLIEQHELDVIDRWRRFVKEVVLEVLPVHAGRLVKSLGDGLMLEFAEVLPAVHASLDMHKRIAAYNAGHASDDALQLRIGAHVADIVVDALDIYGAGVNLASRLAALAGPGEIVVSAEVRDQLVPGLDAELDDLGPCHLKHVSGAVRAHRVSAVGDAGSGESPMRRTPLLKASIAVIPFSPRIEAGAGDAIGDALADEVIAGLSQTAELHVVSRLSTMTFRRRQSSVQEIGSRLGVTYVLSGAFHINGSRIRIHAELADARDASIVWSGGLDGETAQVFTGGADVIEEIVARVGAAIVARELSRAMTQPLPNLDAYTLLMAAIALMHRMTDAEFERARLMLEHLAARYKRVGLPHAWLAKWHVLRVVQGWSTDGPGQARLALEHVHRALDAEPQNALALAIGGLVHAYLKKDLNTADRFYFEALTANPNEPLAWLFSATLHSYREHGAEAELASDKALRLSPLDPLRYFFDSLAATAVLSNANYDRAIELARRSMRANRTHTSTYRALAIAQMLSGRADEARETVRQLHMLEPELTVQRFLERYPGRESTHAQRYADALEAAGLPR